MAELIPPIMRFGKSWLSERTIVSEMLSWIEDNPEVFKKLLEEFDLVVAQFNHRSNLDDPKYINVNQLRQVLGQTTLPKIADLVEETDFSSLLKFGKTFRLLNTMMREGETTKQEPYVKYHTAKDKDIECLVVGTLFHFYEERVRTGGSNAIDRGVVEGAIVESLSTLPQLKLWDAISQPHRLNWVDTWKGFSVAFRTSLDFR